MQPTNHKIYKILGRLVPNPGNVIFTLLIVSITLWTQSTGAIWLGTASQTQTTTISYQGSLTDSNGSPISGPQDITFKLYPVLTGGQPIWTEQRTGANAVQLDNGLFHVMLGRVEPLAQSLVDSHDVLYLAITVGNDNEMTPRIELSGITSNSTSDTKIQNGILSASGRDAGWTLDEGVGEREHTVSIVFDEPFSEVPTVFVGISRFDFLEESASNKAYVYVINETTHGFDLVFRTWSTSQVHRLDVNWLASTSP